MYAQFGFNYHPWQLIRFILLIRSLGMSRKTMSVISLETVASLLPQHALSPFM